MSVLFLFIICVLLALFFYAWDTYNHKKIMIKSVKDIHWQEKQLIEIKAKSLKNEFPIISEVVSSMTYSDDRFDSKKILKHTRAVPKELKDKLHEEIDIAITQNNETAMQVIKWYFFACILISVAEKHYTKIQGMIDISENTKKINRPGSNDLKLKNTFCLV